MCTPKTTHVVLPSTNHKNNYLYGMAEQFVVSALKYRPQTFDTVVGQDHITTTMKNAIKTGHLAHSFLFCGPRGVGKTTCARILAKTINCTNLTPDAEACDTCDSCVAFKNNASFNVHELDAASNNSVDDIRTLVEQVRFMPQAGSKYKVYIIDEVHMLSSNAFNAFLKTLEEPPSYAIFILATTEKHKILPTILSRCQIFDFKRIVNKDVVDHLKNICVKETITAEEDALHFIAQKSEGCMRDALSIMDKIVSFGNGTITYTNTIENLNILDYDYFFKLTDYITAQDYSQAMLLYDVILSKGFEGDSFLNGFAEHMRNLLICKEQSVVGLLDVADGIKNKFFLQANQTNPAFIINAISIINQAELNYKTARNKRLHVELVLIKLSHLPQAIQLISTDEGIVKKKLVTNHIATVVRRVHVPSLVIEKPITYTTASVVTNITVQEPIAQPIVPPIQNTPTTSTITTASNTSTASSGYGVGLSGLGKISAVAKQELEKKAAQISIDVTQENFEPVWLKIVEGYTEGQDIFKNALLSCSTAIYQQAITVNCFTNMALEMLNAKKMDILQKLRAHYHNQDITIEFVNAVVPDVEETIGTKTAVEKFRELAQEHPLIIEFKNQLDLDFDFQ